MKGAPANPITGTLGGRADRVRRMVWATEASAFATSTEGRRDTSAGPRMRFRITGPSPSTKAKSSPIGTSGSRMSAKTIAASTPSRQHRLQRDLRRRAPGLAQISRSECWSRNGPVLRGDSAPPAA